ATSTITLAYTTKHWAAQVEFWGTDGLIRADLESQAVVLYRRPSLKPAVVAFSALSEPIQIIRTTMSTALRYARGQVDKTHDLLIRRYIEAIKQGKPSPVPAAEGRESVRILDLIAQSLSARPGA
ncbi:MAG: hypothetical protein LC772_05115, partial [Chloroflexi bacterium]|nr:hypothetical protein [Chloroflexota bacterium]